MTTVYSNASYMPVAGGFNMLTLSTPFVWNGSGNIVVDTAFGVLAVGLPAALFSTPAFPMAIAM